MRPSSSTSANQEDVADIGIEQAFPQNTLPNHAGRAEHNNLHLYFNASITDFFKTNQLSVPFNRRLMFALCL